MSQKLKGNTMMKKQIFIRDLYAVNVEARTGLRMMIYASFYDAKNNAIPWIAALPRMIFAWARQTVYNPCTCEVYIASSYGVALVPYTV